MNRAGLLGVMLCGAGLLVGTAGAADTRAPTIGDLTRQPGTTVTPSSPEADAAKAMASYRRFLELQKSDPQLRAEALRRLGDLNQETGNPDSVAATAGGGEAIRLYGLLLKAYPNYPRNDQVLYQLAHAYETTGQPEQALATLDQLVRRYPRSPMMDEVQFRRGELLFSARNYRAATDAYAVVIRRGTASSFYAQSLYKHGWSLFKQSMNEECLGSFAGVLDQALLVPPRAMRPLESLPRATREIVDDTLRVMSITFSYLDGAQSVDALVKSRGGPAYTWLLYARLGDLYVDKQRYQDAAGAYRAFVERDPDNDHAPELAMRAIDAYRKGGFGDLVIQGKREYLTHYDFSTPFWKARSRQDHPEVVAELKTNLGDVATYYHAAAQKSGKPEDYREAVRWYRSYLAAFPGDPDSASRNYLLADALFESHQYGDAATEYGHVAYDYPGNPKAAAAGYAGLVAYQKAESGLAGSEKDALHRVAVTAGVKFARTFPEHPESAGVLTRAAEDLYAEHQLPQAMEAAQLLLARKPPADPAKQRIAWTVVGQSRFDQGSFAEAESAYIHARELAAGDPAMSADLGERVAAAVYRQGEAKQKAGDAAGAVEDFLRVARVAPDSKIRATAQYDAAAQLINLKQWDRAITVLNDFRGRFPRSDLAADVTRKLAVAHAEAGQPAQAAAEFERIAANPAEQDAVRHEALGRAADLYEKVGDTPKAVAMLTALVAQYPKPVADAIEVRARLAQIAGRQGESSRQQQLYRDIVQADAQAGAERTDRTRYLAANAQLQLAAPERDAFRAVRLVAPLKVSLAAKRKALERALAAYKVAADYRVAEVTTAATFETAELYRGLGKDVMDSERPKHLSKDESEQYESLLEDQAFPFEEQAIAVHELNAARAREGIYDEWVKKSYAALAQLQPGRYGKTELTQDVVTQLQ